MAGSSYDVSAYWALAGTPVHSFSKALELTIPPPVLFLADEVMQ